jgi:Zn-dependent M28 family amino/carboxypeptidase
MKQILIVILITLAGFVHGQEASNFDSVYAGISESMLRNDIKTLSSDEFEGRSPASDGEIKTINYLRESFRSMGLAPGNGDSYFQAVPLIEITANPGMVLDISGNRYNYGSQFVAWTKRVTPSITITDAELVFVGYGIVAPEYQWNDYAGIDVKGKVVVVLVNDPGFATRDMNLFNGNAMTYYGRWTYKYEEAARQGAAGVLLVHQTAPAAYPWGVVQSSWTGPQFDLVTVDKNMSRTAFEGWIHIDVALELFEKAGLDFRDLEATALTRLFQPTAIGLKVSIGISNKIRESRSHNVAAMLPGSTRAHEFFIYMAHWDHLGIDKNLKGDQIYNGAADNATGTGALLALARSFTRINRQPERSVLFVAVTAEERGLLGSAHYARHPLVATNKTIAGINMDGLNRIGTMKDFTIVGYGQSEMEDYARSALSHQDRITVAESTPEHGSFYRSDHFNLAKAGIPMLYGGGGTDHRQKGKDYVIQEKQEYREQHYHQVSDEYDPDWDLSGAIEDIQVYFRIGYELTNSDAWPDWRETSEFRSVREADIH